MSLPDPELFLVFALVSCCGALLLFKWPEVGLLLNVLLLYLNIPALAVRLYGVPSAIAVATSALLLPGLLRNITSRIPRVVVDLPLLLMILFLASLLLSTLGAKDIDRAAVWIGDFVFEGILLYFLIVNLVRSVPTLRRVTWTLLLGGAFLASLTLYQELTNSYSNEFGGLAQRTLEHESTESAAERIYTPRVREKVRTAHRAQGPIDDPNRYGQMLIVLLPLGWFRMRDERSKLKRLAAAAVTLAILGAVVLTYSRGAFLAIALTLLMMAVFRCITVRQLALGVLVFALAVVAVAPGYSTRMLSLRGLQGLAGDPSAVEADGAVRGRAAEMLAALRVFQDYPVLGVGPGQFSRGYSVTYMSENFQLRRVTDHRRAHSLYLELAAETGALGFSIFTSILLVLLFRLAGTWRLLREQDPGTANYALAFLMGIVGYLSTGIFLQLAYQRYLWFYVALGGAVVHIARMRQAAESDQAVAA